MSSSLTKAIYARLVGTEVLTGQYLTAQQTLAAKLATDPDTSKSAVFKGNMSDFTVFPCITFRENAGLPDKRFQLGNVQGAFVVDYVTYDFEIWGKSRSGVELSNIDDAFKLLVDRRYGAPKFSLETGDVVSSLTITTPTQIYDEKRNAWFLLRRVRFHERFAVAA